MIQSAKFRTPTTTTAEQKKSYLLHIKPGPNINKHLLPIRHFPLNIQRTCQRHQNLILLPVRGATLHAFIDRAHAVLELGLRGTQLGV